MTNFLMLIGTGPMFFSIAMLSLFYGSSSAQDELPLEQYQVGWGWVFILMICISVGLFITGIPNMINTVVVLTTITL